MLKPRRFGYTPGIPKSAQPVTEWLRAWGDGDQAALEQVMRLVHGELRRMARRQMARERRDHLLQPTALVNEAFLRLAGITRMRWQDRAHFLAMCARIMRRVLVDMARARDEAKRGGGVTMVAFDEAAIGHERGHRLLALEDALVSLTALHARKARVVELRFFGGLSVDEIAEVLNVSGATVMRDWQFARAWLRRELGGREHVVR